MCHLILLIPLSGIPLFWFLPLAFALPANIFVWLISAFIYLKLIKAMREPLQDGFQNLIGTKAKVVSVMAASHTAKYLVRSQGELWSAHAAEPLKPGAPVKIVATNGIGLVIEPLESSLVETSDLKTGISGVKRDERHCH